jgi:thiol:disulfide interchange protein
MSFLARSIALLTLIVVAAAAQAEVPPSPIVKTELNIHAPTLAADDIIWAGVTFTIPKGWHIYWQNPGDSGLATSYAWALPAGITAGEIMWPAPVHFTLSGLTSYGYTERVTLPVPLTVTKSGAHGTVSVTAKWAACADLCVPESATLTAELPVSAPEAAKTLEAALLNAPQPLMDADAHFAAEAEDLRLSVTSASLFASAKPPVTAAYFFPATDGIITNSATQPVAIEPTAHQLRLRFKASYSEAPTSLNGVLEITRGTAKEHYQLTVQPGAVAAVTTVEPAPAPIEKTPLLLALALAFVGGLLLNIMPCVLPILALKALTLAKKAEASRAAAAAHGLAYTAGVVTSFLVIAGGMLALKASGAAIGWGFQLQQPAFVAFLLVVMLLVAANLLGLFSLPVLFGARATSVDDSHPRGSFLTGALAVLVATPCTAPFMATALGATLTLAAPLALLVFAALGFGMAAPFLLISLWPAARRLLPKPGAWMTRFKHLLAIPMLATALWLGWVLLQLTTPQSAKAMDANQVAYSPAALEAMVAEGKPVLVDVTAAWCLTCKVNARVAFAPASMQQFFREKNITIMVADWTSSAPEITAYLTRFGRNGVPLYVYYPPQGDPRVLPQLLTPSVVREALGN